MIRTEDLLRDLDSAVDPSDVEIVLRRAGSTHMFWQTWDLTTVYTWDRVPPGFFSLYYGLDSDRFCAIATAIRSGWISFTFKQARDVLGKDHSSKDAEKIWTNFGMLDGVCMMQGFGSRRSLLVAATSGNAERMLDDMQVVFAAAAAKLDMLLRDRLGTLYQASRSRGLLSPAENAVIRAQIDYPQFTIREQANLLKISPRTLQRRHADIAKKLGVSTFPGAIVVALEREQARMMEE